MCGQWVGIDVRGLHGIKLQPLDVNNMLDLVPQTITIVEGMSRETYMLLIARIGVRVRDLVVWP